ncbi:hypothetical protein EMGBS8_14650 [Verrucomicrobiota bacterium]|nr:hypothetical protein EMGBS8_14650 [Verrucomicrobiota bacterium]
MLGAHTAILTILALLLGGCTVLKVIQEWIKLLLGVPFLGLFLGEKWKLAY